MGVQTWKTIFFILFTSLWLGEPHRLWKTRFFRENWIELSRWLPEWLLCERRNHYFYFTTKRKRNKKNYSFQLVIMTLDRTTPKRDEILLSNTKNTDTLIERTKTKPQENLKFTKQQTETFWFDTFLIVEDLAKKKQQYQTSFSWSRWTIQLGRSDSLRWDEKKAKKVWEEFLKEERFRSLNKCTMKLIEDHQGFNMESIIKLPAVKKFFVSRCCFSA